MIQSNMKCASCGRCPECGDGDPDWFYEHARCAFGCGSRVNMDIGLCRSCLDHSANEAICDTCGYRWADWLGGKIEADHRRPA